MTVYAKALLEGTEAMLAPLRASTAKLGEAVKGMVIEAADRLRGSLSVAVTAMAHDESSGPGCGA